MGKPGLILGIVFFLMVGCSVTNARNVGVKPFPPAEEGMERFVIALDEKSRAEEGLFMVELMAGKTLPTDGVNQVRLGSSIEPVSLKGWGYTYYKVTGSGKMMSTLMASPKDAPQVEAFVMGAPLKVRYNSRLPIVVYAPKGFEIRYRVWEASGTTHAAKKG